MRARLLAGVLLAVAPTVSPALTFVELARDGVAGVDGLGGAAALAVSPDGAQLYVVGRVDDAVAAFLRDPLTGQLTFVERQRDGLAGVDGLAGASALAPSPDGHHVYVAGADDGALAAFVRDAVTGALTFLEVKRNGLDGVSGLAGASGVAVTPDGAYLYVTGRADGAVATFSRDAATGMLGFVATVQGGVAGVDGIGGASALALSPDGQNVYVAGGDQDAVAVFTRDVATGTLGFDGMQRDGVGGVDGVRGASGVAVSPDGAHVYVTGRIDDAVAVFRRDGASGALAFVEAQRDGASGVDGLNGAAGVAISADGARVYVAGADDDALAAFARDSASGALTFLERARDGQGGVNGLNGAAGVAVSPDAGFVYVAGASDNAVAVFSTATTSTTTSTTTTTLPPCPPAPGSGCRMPEQSLLVVKGPGRVLRWRWQGPSAGPIEFGDPRSTTRYSLCLYDAHRDPPALLLAAIAPAGGHCAGRRCWRTVDNVGYRYRDPDRTPRGIARILLRSAGGRARVVVAGGGGRLQLPRLPLVPPVTIQLVAADVGCWQAVYGVPAANGPRRFRAR